jgi:PPOX class probable F420-dependent enzyme
MPTTPPISQIQRDFLVAARSATLATIDPDGRPRLVPICFVLDPASPVLYTPLDDKPKRTDDVLDLARVRDIAARPDVTILVDRWDEEWSRLAWLRCGGRAALVPPIEPGHAKAIVALRAKYPQYATHDIGSRPLIAVTIERATSWGALAEAADVPSERPS